MLFLESIAQSEDGIRSGSNEQYEISRVLEISYSSEEDLNASHCTIHEHPVSRHCSIVQSKSIFYSIDESSTATTINAIDGIRDLVLCYEHVTSQIG